jgi:excinuclease ABC subunit B
LVAILDADKEGFLRSERSIIQTVGRAARNLRGRAILYADKMTGSMERAIAESEKRREVQLAFNKENNITPRGVTKRVADVMEGAYGSSSGRSSGRSKRAADKYNLLSEDVAKMDTKALTKELSRLESKMYEFAKNLDFESAAAARDQIGELKNRIIAS